MTLPTHEARIARAKLLQQKYPFANEVLGFYVRLNGFQKVVWEKVRDASKAQGFGQQHASLREQIDTALLLPEMRGLLGVIEEHAPGPLAEFAASLRKQPSAEWARIVAAYCTSGGLGGDEADPKERLVARVVTQPFAELLASRAAGAPLAIAAASCPLCGGLPSVGVMRPEGDGGKRFLICSFCGFEWEFRRILCAACGETREGQLPVYVAEELPHLRVESCDTCRKFLRTVDLTKDGNAVPVVDDLAAIPLTLWAQEHGYERIASNLLET